MCCPVKVGGYAYKEGVTVLVTALVRYRTKEGPVIDLFRHSKDDGTYQAAEGWASCDEPADEKIKRLERELEAAKRRIESLERNRFNYRSDW